jgi:ADP-heptose:LPS heptosyltransferase
MKTDRDTHVLRVLDRYLGVPLVALLRLRRVWRRRSRPTTIRRIGLIKTAAIGDTILLSAITRDIAAAFPAADVMLFTGPENYEIGTLLDGVSHVVKVPVTRPWRAAREIRRHQLDVLIDCGQWPRVDAAITAMSRASFTIGFRTRGQARHFAYDVAVPHSAELHEVDNYRQLARVIGVTSRSLPSLRDVPCSPDDELPAYRFVVFHLWAGGYMNHMKQWPAERWRQLAGELVADGMSIVLTGGPADVRRAKRFIDESTDLGSSVVDLTGRYSVRELICLLRRSSCVVSVNTGVMHLAAVLGVPTVALNGPVPERRWGPVGPRVRSVNSTLPGCGYLNLGWEYDGARADCMESIAVADVLAAVREVLRSPPSSSVKGASESPARDSSSSRRGGSRD